MEKTLLMRIYLNGFSKSEKIGMVTKMPFDMLNLKKKPKKKEKNRKKKKSLADMQ